MGKINENGVYINSKGIKTFIPLENNPEVFTHLVHKLGVSPKLGFYDVYSTDHADLLAMIPRPAHALIFISPADIYHKVRKQDKAEALTFDGEMSKPDDTKKLTYDGSGEQEPVFWMKQTIGHACGLIALLHCVSNGSAKQYVLPNSDLDEILKEGLPLKPGPRADVLYNSQALEKAHMESARKGDSVAPSSEEPNGYHFIGFVRGKDGHLWELEGSSNGPIDRGDLGAEEDMLAEKALRQGVRRFIDAGGDNVEFSIVALATAEE